jgi:hypothetical protein
MANRFAIGDTLGAQLYSRYQSDLTNRYLQEKALEEERQRREAERRRQEEQRRKASNHGAFGQTLQTIGQIGGAIIGAKYGGAEGAIAGSSLGSAGASTIMNLFPNMGGTEPDGSNPYYDKPSDMARLGSTINTGLKAYGMYTDSAKPKAREAVINRLTSEMDSGITWDDGGQTLSYYSASPEQLAARIEGFDEYKNATGIFGEELLKGSSLSIANTINKGIKQTILPQVEFTNSLPDSEQKRKVLTNLQKKYGQNLTNLLPEGSLAAMDVGVQQNIDKTTQGATKDANARAVQLFETNYKIAQLGQKKTIDPINVEGADPQLQSSLNRLVEATRAATEKGNTKAANDELKKDAASVLQDVTTALGKTEQGSQAQQALSSLATGLAQQAYGLDPETTSVIYSNLSKDVKPPQDDLLKTAQEIAQRQFLELTKRDGEQYTPEQVAKLHIKNDPTLRSPVTLEILRLASGAKDNQELIAYAESLKEVEVDEAKQKSWYERWGIFNYIFGGSESDVSETQLNNNASANGNPDLLNRIFSNLPSLNGR